MARAPVPLFGFNGGEWSPQLHGRVDVTRQQLAVRLMQNAIATYHGGGPMRPGTYHAARTKSDLVARALPFVFSREQAYAIEATNLAFRFYSEGVGSGGASIVGRVEDPPGTPIEIATPYAAADIAAVQYAQSFDVLYLVHGGHRVRELRRASHVSWSIADFAFEDGPYLDLNTGPITIAPSAVTGSGITLTASASLFQPGHVGSLWRIEEAAGHLNYDEWSNNESYTAGDLVKWASKVYEADANGTSGERPPEHTEGTHSDGGVDWIYRHSGHGYVRVTGYTNATTVTATVVKRLPSTGATAKWREGAWSDVRGWPACIGFFAGRLWLAGTAHQPQTFWASSGTAYNDFAPTDHGSTVLDDQAITRTLASEEACPIRWMRGGKVLQLGTDAGIFVVGPANPNQALTPTNIDAARRPKTPAAALLPVAAGDDETLYIDATRRHLHEVAYRFDTDNYPAPEMSRFAQHLTRRGLAGLAWQRQPWSVVWAHCDDGLLLGFTYLREEEVTAWHRHPIGGRHAKVLSVLVLPAGGEDRLWLVTERTVNGSTMREVAWMAPQFWPEEDAPIDRWPHDNAFLVDSGLTYDGWNGDPAKTLQLQGGAPWKKGELKTLVASGHSPFAAGDVAAMRVWKFRLKGDPDIPDLSPPLSVRTVGYTDSTHVSVELLNDLPASLQGSAVSFWGRATRALAGLDHLEAETLAVAADGAAHPPVVVASGAIALQTDAVVVHAGLGYPAAIETMDLDQVAVQLGQKVGAQQRVANIGIRFRGTLGARVGIEGNMDRVEMRTVADAMDSPPPLFSGVRTVSFPKGWDKAMRVRIEQDLPLPFEAQGLHLLTEVNDG